jgi:hypothetical protein
VTAARTIREIVRKVEADLEWELGSEDFARLPQLLVELNATSFVRASSDATAEAVYREIRPYRYGNSNPGFRTEKIALESHFKLIMFPAAQGVRLSLI